MGSQIFVSGPDIVSTEGVMRKDAQKQIYTPWFALLSLVFVFLSAKEIVFQTNTSRVELAWHFWICYYIFFGSMHVGLTFVNVFLFKEGRNFIRNFDEHHRIPFMVRVGILFAIFSVFSASFYFYDSKLLWMSVFLTICWILIRGVALPIHVLAQQRSLFRWSQRESDPWVERSVGCLTAFMPVAIVSQILFSRYLNSHMRFAVGQMNQFYVPQLMVISGGVILAYFIYCQYRLGRRAMVRSTPIVASLILWMMCPFSDLANFSVFGIHGLEYALTFGVLASGQSTISFRRVVFWALIASSFMGFIFIWRAPFDSIFGFVGDPRVSWKRGMIAFQQAIGFLHLELDALIYRRAESPQKNRTTLYDLLRKTSRFMQVRPAEERSAVS